MLLRLSPRWEVCFTSSCCSRVVGRIEEAHKFVVGVPRRCFSQRRFFLCSLHLNAEVAEKEGFAPRKVPFGPFTPSLCSSALSRTSSVCLRRSRAMLDVSRGKPA